MNGPSKGCALVITKSKVYTDPIGVENRLWPLQCPQRKFGIFHCLLYIYRKPRTKRTGSSCHRSFVASAQSHDVNSGNSSKIYKREMAAWLLRRADNWINWSIRDVLALSSDQYELTPSSQWGGLHNRATCYTKTRRRKIVRRTTGAKDSYL
jgi:hypothetical protein